MSFNGWINGTAALALAPLLPGIINRVKAGFAGRRGPPLAQMYFDLFKLLGKGAVYSRTTTWLVRAGPVAGAAAGVLAVFLLPLGGAPAPLPFPGDFILLAGLLGFARLFTILAALDTGSAFEGMGASREATFSALAEPVLLLTLAGLVRQTGATSLTGLLGGLTPAAWSAAGPALFLLAAALFVLLLAENSRIPVDDPNTHLELTMIHEAMVLDHGGPDLGLILYGACLKLWVFGVLLAGVLVPYRSGVAALDALATFGGVVAVMLAVGVVESIMARLRLIRVPQLLVAAGAFAAMALILLMR